MLQTFDNGTQKPAASAWGPVVCLAGVLLLSPMPARAQDPRWQVAIRKTEQPGPSAAYLAAAAYDAKRENLMIAGGVDLPNRDVSRALLQFDVRKGAWSSIELADTSPGAVVKPALVYDPKRDALFLFGGWAPGTDRPSAQLWTMPLAGEKKLAWQPVDVGAHRPPHRNGCIMVLDLHGDRLLVHGGDWGPHPTYGYTPLNDLWAFDLTKRQWSRLKPVGQLPEARWDHTATVDQKNRKMFVFGGGGHVDGRLVRDNCVFELDLEKLSWARHAGRGDAPVPVLGATMTYDTSAEVLVVVGGLSVADTGPPGSKSLWLFDLKTKTWLEYPDVFATTRRDHTAIYDPHGRQHVVYGGGTAKERANYYASGEPLRDTLMISITSKE